MKKVGSSINLCPQPVADDGFFSTIQTKFQYNNLYQKSSGTYLYNYNQNLGSTYHGLASYLIPNREYVFSFDAFVSSDTQYSGTDNIPVGAMVGFDSSGEVVVNSLSYDKSSLGVWKHFETKLKIGKDYAVVMLAPTSQTGDPSSGLILYKNVELKETGSNTNLFAQPKNNEGFNYRGNGIFNLIQ